MELAIELFQNFLIAILLGALVGLEREFSQIKQEFAGIRTFMLIALLGAILAFLSRMYGTWLMVLGFSAFALFVAIAYYTNSRSGKAPGATTEVSSLLTFMIGVMCINDMSDLAIILTIVMTVLLSLKPVLHNFAKRISREEFHDTLKFAIIAFVILPFLPNKVVFAEIFNSVGLVNLDVFNPYETWLLVVLVSGISFAGYILVKTVGAKRGLVLTGVLGGLASSTALTTSLSIQSKKSRLINPFVAGIVVATAITFIRILFLVMVLNAKLLTTLIIPMTSMAAAGATIALYFWKREEKNETGYKTGIKSPFTLKPALTFGALFVIIMFVSNAASLYFGERGIYATAFLSGLADVDAITISMAKLSAGGMNPNVAVTAITIAAAVNTLVKGGIAYYFASRNVSNRVILSFFLVLIVGAGALMFL